MTARVVKIGKKSWVAGLSWLSCESVPSKAELQKDATHYKASWAAIRLGQEAIQGGFCAPIAGVKNPSKLISLAAMMADSQRQPWLGIFKIEEGVWWYVAVRDGHAILPDGDVIGSEAEIRAAQDAHAGLTGWNYVEGDLAYLQELLSQIDAKPTRLKSLTGTGISPNLVAGAVLAAITVAGGTAYWMHAKQQQQDEDARLAAIHRARVLAAQKTPLKVVTTTPAAPAPADWLRACGEILHSRQLSEYGWKLDQVGCDSKAAVVRWIALPGASVAHHPPGVISDQGDSIEQRIDLPTITPRDGSDAVALTEAKLAARAWALVKDHQLSFVTIAQPAPLPGSPAPAPQAVAPSQVGVSIDMGPSPLQTAIADQLTSLPGLRLLTLKSTETGYHLDGVIYGR